jgi:hypothetical protein
MRETRMELAERLATAARTNTTTSLLLEKPGIAFLSGTVPTRLPGAPRPW